MKILLTGASGLLGAAFAKAAARRRHQVIGIVGSYQDEVEGLARQQKLDLADAPELERSTLDLFPDAIVNCAAISRANECEAQPDHSHRINVELPAQLGLLSRHFFAPFLHISSEQVFDGKTAPYKVDSPTNPLTLYAQQKRNAEIEVAKIAPANHITLRVPLLSGNSLPGTRSIHEQLFAAWSQGKQTPLFEDEYRQIAPIDNIADVMVELLERDDIQGKLYHWAGEKSLSRWEMGQSLIQHFGLPETLIQRAQRGDDPRFADRQADLSMDLQPLAALLKTQAQAFGDHLDTLIVPKPFRSWYNAI
ncbi:MAG: SDR family oxidoreductase [Verrucomicrobiota bacterium]